MNKDEIIAKLTELGIEHDPSAKKADLLALLPEDQRGGDNGDGDDESDAKGSFADVIVSVAGRSGSTSEQVARTYSKDVHGSKFKANAEEYAGKIGGKVRVR